MCVLNTKEIEISILIILKHLLVALLMRNLGQFPGISPNAKRYKMIPFTIQSLESLQVKYLLLNIANH
jgi:hypothetical protein